MGIPIRCPICLWSPSNLDYRFVWESTFWRVVLAPNQSLLGRCVVHLKRHVGDLADLHSEEMLEWLEVLQTLEAALRSAFGATLFNWSCYMNHAYRESEPDPHVHWWFVPRYNHTVEIGSCTFEDPSFGNPYNHARQVVVPPELHGEIAGQIQQAIKTTRDNERTRFHHKRSSA